jgi:hypothetical protein
MDFTESSLSEHPKSILRDYAALSIDRASRAARRDLKNL